VSHQVADRWIEVKTVSPTAQQSLLETQVTEYGSTEMLGANMLPRDAKAHPGPGEVLDSAMGPMGVPVASGAWSVRTEGSPGRSGSYPPPRGLT